MACRWSASTSAGRPSWSTSAAAGWSRPPIERGAMRARPRGCASRSSPAATICCGSSATERGRARTLRWRRWSAACMTTSAGACSGARASAGPHHQPRSRAPARATPRRGPAMQVLLSAFSCAPHSGSEPGSAGIGRSRSPASATRSWCSPRRATRPRSAPRLRRRPAASEPRLRVLHAHWLGRLAARGLPLQLVHLAWQFAAYRHVRRQLAPQRFDLIHHITFCVIRQPSFLDDCRCRSCWGRSAAASGSFALRAGMGARGWWLGWCATGSTCSPDTIR